MPWNLWHFLTDSYWRFHPKIIIFQLYTKKWRQTTPIEITGRTCINVCGARILPFILSNCNLLFNFEWWPRDQNLLMLHTPSILWLTAGTSNQRAGKYPKFWTYQRGLHYNCTRPWYQSNLPLLFVHYCDMNIFFSGLSNHFWLKPNPWGYREKCFKRVGRKGKKYSYF